MDYQKIYKSLIDRGLNRFRDDQTYYEEHHIVPRCMGGSDDKSNLVYLTPEEHYVAHQLLVKIYPNNFKLIMAAQMMIPNRSSNKLYGWIRRSFSKVMSESQSGSGNSQFGTMWINDGVISKKITIDSVVPTGWNKGRVKKQKIKSQSKLELRRLKNIEVYREYYKIYCEYGWEKFVTIVDYKYTKSNFVTRCSDLLEEFVSQNGKKRGI